MTLSVTYVTSKSVEVSELSEGAFARVVEIKFSIRPFAGHSNKQFPLTTAVAALRNPNAAMIKKPAPEKAA